MPTIALKPQANGFWQDVDTIVGASSPYLCVDDSDGTTHDSDTTKFRLPRAGTVFTGRGIVSFPMFLQAEGLIPSSITINVAAKRTAGGNPGILIGFNRAGVTAFDLTPFSPGASYTVESRTFALTSPFAPFLPWAAADLIGLEVCLQSELGSFAGSNQVTLISGSLDYYPSTFQKGRRPWMTGVGG